MNGITKDTIKAEIDRLPDEHLDVLYRFVKALETRPSEVKSGEKTSEDQRQDWQRFVDKTYGCLRDAPIERSGQGGYEVRGPIE